MDMSSPCGRRSEPFEPISLVVRVAHPGSSLRCAAELCAPFRAPTTSFQPVVVPRSRTWPRITTWTRPTVVTCLPSSPVLQVTMVTGRVHARVDSRGSKVGRPCSGHVAALRPTRSEAPFVVSDPPRGSASGATPGRWWGSGRRRCDRPRSAEGRRAGGRSGRSRSRRGTRTRVRPGSAPASW